MDKKFKRDSLKKKNKEVDKYSSIAIAVVAVIIIVISLMRDRV